MNRIRLALLTLALIALAACAPAAASGEPSRTPSPLTSPAAVPAAGSVATATPTVVLPTPDLSRMLSDQLAFTDPAQAGQSMRELTDWAREASGLRAALGPQADEIFRLADQAQNAALLDILRQMQPAVKPKGMPAPLPPRLGSPLAPNQFVGMSYVVGVLAMAPGRLEPPRNGDTNPITSSQEYDQELGENVQAHVKTTSTISGSRMQVEAEITIRVEKDGQVYEEKANGKITLNACPDPQGQVPLDLAFQSQASASGVGLGLQVTAHVIGHVDDEANLTSADLEIQSEMSVTKGKNWLTGAPDTSFAQIDTKFTIGGLTSKDSSGRSYSNAQVSMPRSSFLVSRDLTQGTMKTGMLIATMAWYMALTQAQDKWQNGLCVAIIVPEGESQRVMAGADTNFTAVVRHKFEGQELNVPVVATLTSGQVSVTPSSTKVPAPATFRYKAPNKAGEEATVELVSRSRRGIGKLVINLLSEGLFYRVDQIVGLPGSRLTGTICALDRPFTLQVKGANATGGTYVGSFKFKPADTHGGRWTHNATTSCLPEWGCAGVTGSGTYQVEDLPGGGAKILMSQAAMVSGFGTGSLQMAFDFDLEPDSGVCNPD